MAISSQQLTIYLYIAHRAVIFAIAQVACYVRDAGGRRSFYSSITFYRLVCRPTVVFWNYSAILFLFISRTTKTDKYTRLPGFYPGSDMMGVSHREGAKLRHEGPRAGWGSWEGAASPLPPHQLRGLGSGVSSPSRFHLKFGATWDLKSHSRNTK